MLRSMLPIFVFAAVLAAQPGPGPMGGGRTDALKSALNLSDDQVTKLRDLRRAEMDAARPILEKLRTNREALSAAVDKGTDAAAIGNLVLAAKTLRQQITTTNESYHKQALAVLNPTQQNDLKKVQDATALVPAIGEARALNLLDRPDDDEFGFGIGPFGRGGPPRGFGPQGFGGGRRRQ